MCAVCVCVCFLIFFFLVVPEFPFCTFSFFQHSMAPLALKIKGKKTFACLTGLDSEEDFSKTWRVCTKVKDALEEGTRLENLSWRLWFRQHLLTNKRSKLSATAPLQLNHHHATWIPPKMPRKTTQLRAAAPTSALASAPGQGAPTAEWPASTDLPSPASIKLTQVPVPALTGPTVPGLQPMSAPLEAEYLYPNQRHFTLHRFASDEASDRMAELEDIFAMSDTQRFLSSVSEDAMPMWNFGYPSPTDGYFTPQTLSPQSLTLTQIPSDASFLASENALTSLSMPSSPNLGHSSQFPHDDYHQQQQQLLLLQAVPNPLILTPATQDRETCYMAYTPSLSVTESMTNHLLTMTRQEPTFSAAATAPVMNRQQQITDEQCKLYVDF